MSAYKNGDFLLSYIIQKKEIALTLKSNYTQLSKSIVNLQLIKLKFSAKGRQNWFSTEIMKRLIFLLTLFIYACGSKDESFPPATIERLDEQIMSVKSKAELERLLKKNQIISENFLGGSPEDTAFVADIFFMIENQDAQSFYGQVKETFGNLAKIKADFGQAFGEIKKLYPDFKEPRIVTAFTGLRNDMLISDSLVVVSLEAFIGSKAKYKLDYPNYILTRYQPDYIVPNVIRVLSNKYNEIDTNNDNFTTDLIFFGKSLEFCRTVLPHIPDSLIIGYSNLDLQHAYENQDYIWAHIIDRNLLNSNNPAVNAKYFGERPYVAEISPDCPARIGQWLGWRIVELYREKNPKVSIQDLMKNKNALEILRGSKYRGQLDENNE